MPSKHDDNKKQVAFWLSPQEREMLESAARMHGMNMTELVKAAIAKMLMEATDAGDRDNQSDNHADKRGVQGNHEEGRK